MSDHHSEESENPIGKIIGIIFMFAVPAALLLMLAMTGAAFVGGLRAPDPAAVEKGAIGPGAAATGNPAGTGDGNAVATSQMDLGKAAYATCAACHGPDGTGMPVGPLKMAPSLVGSEMLLGDPDQSLLIVLKGIQKETADYAGVMATLAAALDDEKLAAVLTYTRNSWGNSAPPVTVEQAKSARERFMPINAPAGIKRSEIAEIVEAHSGE
ncbi:MAG: cytochrome c [Verrucomicrobiales bacterium]|nr:cytochrome c [Verrucomicrobiales bacterium]